MQGATVLLFPGEATSLLGDVVQEVPLKIRVNASEDAWPKGRGMDLPWLRQG